MSHLPATELTVADTSASSASNRPGKPPPGWLISFLDPEWLVFEAFLLIPALLCLSSGDVDRTLFYGRLALHLGCLKWLGWAILTRASESSTLRYLRFPLELTAGLTVAVVWFYLRNVVGWIVPGSYGLRELAILPWLVASGHLVGAVVHRPSIAGDFVGEWQTTRSLLPRAGLYSAFALTLTLTLWSAGKEIFAPSLDGWFHAFIARVYLNDGFLYPHFNGGHAIFYASGFGAINAVTAAISGLSPVKVHNLQHILWVVVGLYGLTAAVALAARRPLAVVQVLPLLFLNVCPVHNLPPDVHWTHGPQQIAAPLLIVIPILSLLLPARRRAFYTGVAIQAALSVIVLALSPVCAIFLLLTCSAGLLINCYRGRVELGEGVLKVASVQAGLTALAALLVLGSDPYYSKLILSPGEASYMTGSHYGGDAATGASRLFSFSPKQGLTAIAAVNPFDLIHWPAEKSHLPGRHLAWFVLALTAGACVFAGRGRRAAPPPARYLAVGAAASLIGWLAAKYGMNFFAGGITNPSQDAVLLYAYLFFLGRRVELWLLFLAALTAGVSVHLSPRSGWERTASRATIAGALLLVAAWWLPYAPAYMDPRRNYLIPRNRGVSGHITADDLALTSWMESNLPAGKGLIALTSLPFKFGDTKLLFPIGASQALPLYGKGYNFCFQIHDPSRTYSYDDYTQRVVNFLDVAWCLKNNIRYFHLPNGDLSPNHGLSRALEIGLLRPVRTTSSSGVYEVRPLPWTPRVMTIPPTPDSSFQVRWVGDGSGVAEGQDPQLVFTLKRPEFVHAIRFRYVLTNPERLPASAQLFWRRTDQSFAEHERAARLRLEPNTQEETLTILVHDTVDQFRFDPDNKPCTFRIREIELLIKPPDDQD